MKVTDVKRQLKGMANMFGADAFCKASVVALLVMAVSPFTAMAQTDDVYFVPKKEKQKVLVVKSVTEKYVVDDNVQLRDVDEYNRRTVGYTDDPEAYIEENFTDEYVGDEYNDYDYSTRIIRFRSPNRALGSSIYWDLYYDCGVRDWMVVDNGYSIDIYPTANNPLYMLNTASYVWNSLNFYNWRDWYNRYYWNYDYWSWGWGWNHPHTHWWHNYCYHGITPHMHNHYHAYNDYNWMLNRPRRNQFTHVPSVGGRRPASNDRPVANTGVGGGRDNKGVRPGRGGNSGSRVDLRGVNGNSGRNDKIHLWGSV